MTPFAAKAVLALTLGAGFALAACSGGAGSSTQANGSAVDGNGTDPGANPAAAPDPSTESCYAVFHWLQKDAYKNTGGRTNASWPPHTTTTMEVHCVDNASGDDQIVGNQFRENHGSAPGALDPNGRSLLDEVKVSDPAPGTRADLLGLLDQYTQCECAPATQFLSTTSAQGPLEQQLLGAVIGYVQANLMCAGDVSTNDFVGLLQNGDFDGALAALPSCSWSNGADWSTGLEQATQAMAAATQSELTSYHVCNNDAQLEAELFTSFVSTGTVGACDNASPTCAGPTWFYTP